MKTIFLCNKPENIPLVYADVTEPVYSETDLLADPIKFASVEYVFSTWGMPKLTEEQIAQCLPKLKTVFYAAGSVQDFARPFLRRGIAVCSAWAANGVPVAEYTVAQIILANKRFFSTAAAFKQGEAAAKEIRKEIRGNYGDCVGIIGAGMIGKRVITMLKAYHLQVKVFDPFLPQETAEELGVTLCGLQELFSTCTTVSNHLANNEQTRGMLTGELLRAMPYGGTFLNTGRGAQVREQELLTVLRERPDLTAVLDVTDPKSPVGKSDLAKLPNCWLTPHIAGSLGMECRRMGEIMLEEYRRGAPYRWAVTEKMLETMA